MLSRKLKVFYLPKAASLQILNFFFNMKLIRILLEQLKPFQIVIPQVHFVKQNEKVKNDWKEFSSRVVFCVCTIIVSTWIAKGPNSTQLFQT